MLGGASAVLDTMRRAMRTLPTLLLVLGAAAGIGLGLTVMWGAGPQTAEPRDGGSDGAAVGVPVARDGVPQGHFYTGASEEPKDVNPLTAHGNVARRLVHFYTHEGLLEVDPATGELRPMLAERFEVDTAANACTFTLRTGVRFADGSPMTLEDVLFPWQLARAGHLPMGGLGDVFARVLEVEPIDDRRFRVLFRDQHFAALRIVGEGWCVVSKPFFVARVAARCAPEPVPAVDSAQFAVLLDQIDHECGPGTGPYLFENDPNGVQRWRPRQDLRLVVNPNSWRRAASPGTWNFAGFHLLWRDQAAAMHALLRGEIDWFTTFNAEGLVAAQPQLTAGYDLLRYDYEALGVYRVMWNCKRPGLGDPRVRRALGMLFDGDALLAQFPGAGKRAVAHCKPDSPACPRELQPLAFDPSQARALLRDAGFDAAQGTPLRLRVVAVEGTDILRRCCDLFADAANQAGVELELLRRDWGGYMEEKIAGDWDGLLSLQSFRAWGDPYDLLHSEGLDNDGKWANADADRLASAARIEPDPARRAELWRELHTIVYQEQPATLVLHPLVSVLLDKRIERESIGRNGLVLERAFVAPERQRP
jgi:peptide/nickel transport system substrate-binding protein